MRQHRILISSQRRLFANKLRVTLALSAIAVGIAAVITAAAIGTGARNTMLAQIEALGKNLVTIDAGKVKEVIGRRRQTSKATTLKEKDCAAIVEESRHPISVAPTQEQTLLVKYGNGTTSCRVIGTTPDYPKIRNYQVAGGEFFSDEDSRLSARVAVVGAKVTDNLMSGRSAVGESIRINNAPFEIVGVLAPKGSSYDGANEDEIVLIPLRTGMRRLFNVDYIKNIYVSVEKKENMDSVAQDIRALLRERHRLDIRDKEDDFTIQNSYTTLAAEAETSDSFALMISGVAGLALLVGGVGILAIMLLSVRERTPEIGLRIAVGARGRDILLQFLLEALVLSCVGGIVGIMLGFGATLVIGGVSQLHPLISAEAVVLSLVTSTLLGMFFGIYPAIRASRVQPVVALRG